VTGDYTQQIEQAITQLTDAFLRQEKQLRQVALDIDHDVLLVVRRIGLGVVRRVITALAKAVTEEACAAEPALVVQRRPSIKLEGIFGTFEVESPYLWAPQRSVRPVRTELGLRHGQRSTAVQRALTDFGAEESFGLAVVRFEEHYGWAIGRTTALRVVEGHAQTAEAYVAERLSKAARAFDEPLATRPGVDQMLVELDGCEIRTGCLAPLKTRQRTPVRRQRRRQRREEWRDVRVGLARRLDAAQRTFVARMDGYPAVVRQLFEAAVERGLSSRTATIAVCDGGNGLREELAAQFPNLQFIYDQPHLKEHLYEAADAQSLADAARHEWVKTKIDRIAGGHVAEVIRQFASHRGRGQQRVRRLAKHLRRFRDAVHYDSYRERGLPIGSGEVESAHRYIPQKRLKLPGACWRPETINPMLALRVIRANGWWNDYWTTRARVHAA
jgi:hypothetical protein